MSSNLENHGSFHCKALKIRLMPIAPFTIFYVNKQLYWPHFTLFIVTFLMSKESLNEKLFVLRVTLSQSINIFLLVFIIIAMMKDDIKQFYYIVF